MPDSNKNKENKSQKKGNKSQNLVLLVHLLLGIWKDHRYIQQGQTGGTLLSKAGVKNTQREWKKVQKIE